MTDMTQMREAKAAASAALMLMLFFIASLRRGNEMIESEIRETYPLSVYECRRPNNERVNESINMYIQLKDDGLLSRLIHKRTNRVSKCDNKWIKK